MWFKSLCLLEDVPCARPRHGNSKRDFYQSFQLILREVRLEINVTWKCCSTWEWISVILHVTLKPLLSRLLHLRANLYAAVAIFIEKEMNSFNVVLDGGIEYLLTLHIYITIKSESFSCWSQDYFVFYIRLCMTFYLFL